MCRIAGKTRCANGVRCVRFRNSVCYNLVKSIKRSLYKCLKRATDQTRVIVSFCIPVYNNSEAAVKIVHDLLASQDTRFEIVLSDDASTDDTQELLSQIHDPRFKYFRNAQNLGAHQNWLHSLELGSGQWLYLVMGRDKLYGENIHSLIDSLEYARKNGVTCVMDSFQKQKGIRIYSGIDAMIKFLKTGHPTGTVLDRDIFRELPNPGEYFTHSDMYPENYLRRDMLIRGKGAYINSGVNSLGRINYTKKTSNVDTSRDLWKIFFAPERVIKQSFELIDMVDIDLQDTFTERERSRFFRSSFYWMLIRVSFTWRNHCSNPVLIHKKGRLPGTGRKYTQGLPRNQSTYSQQRHVLPEEAAHNVLLHCENIPDLSGSIGSQENFTAFRILGEVKRNNQMAHVKAIQ